MNKKLILIGLLASAPLAIAEHTPVDNSGFYVGGLAGVTLKSDVSDSDGIDSVDFEFSPGYRLGVAAGYKFNQFRVEGELAFMHNRTDKIKLNGVDTGMDDDLDTTAVFLNGLYDINTGSALTPYLGLGIGYANISEEVSFQGATASGDDDYAAYQAIVGVDYALNNNLKLTADYRYFDTFEDADLENHSVNLGLRYSF